MLLIMHSLNEPHCFAFAGKNGLFSGRVFIRPSIRSSISTYFALRDISSFNGQISLKLATIYSPCVWALLKRSEVEGQGYSDTKCTFATEAYFSGVALRLTCLSLGFICMCGNCIVVNSDVMVVVTATLNRLG